MISKIVDIIYIILNFIQIQLQHSQNEKLQNETDKIEDDPVDWFDKHFNRGMHIKPESKEETRTADIKDSQNK